MDIIPQDDLQLTDSLGDNRKTPRYPLNYEISYEVSDGISTAKSSMPTNLKGIASNISEGGICMSTSNILKTSQVVKMGIPLIGVETKVNVLAEVRWTRQLEAEQQLVGLQFFM